MAIVSFGPSVSLGQAVLGFSAHALFLLSEGAVHAGSEDGAVIVQSPITGLTKAVVGNDAQFLRLELENGTG